MRDRSIDVGRGLLVLMMVYGHVMQFFADTQMFKLAGTLIEIINLTVFPTFVFFFGATAVLAYLDKPYKRALPGMVKMMLRSLGVFYLSGIGYRVLREGKPFAAGTVRRILLLSDIPGWSEFLVSFALYGLLLIAAFNGLKWLSNKPLPTLIACAICLICCEIVPYDSVQPVQLQLLIGGRDFACFPVVQYMPYFFAGMMYARGERKTRLWLLALSTAATAVGCVYVLLAGGLPSRFPPDLMWILLPALNVAAVLLLAKGLCALCGGGMRRVADTLCAAFSHFGSRSLYYLLTSNLVLFTLSGAGIAPAMKRKSVLPWTAPIQSPQGAAVWTAVLLAAIWFTVCLAGRGGRKRDKSAPNRE